MATYFDANNKSSTKYTNIKKVHDDALNSYVKAKGTMGRPNSRYGKHVFTHITKFPYVQKPLSSMKDAYYVLHHMGACGWDHQQLMLLDHLREWTTCLSRIQDKNINQDFFLIQVEFCEIIYKDVLRSSGEFYNGYQPSNSEIDTMVQMQGDDYRPWMTMNKGGS
jgi:hypothetical protein